MSKKANPTVVGTFVLVAIALVVAAIAILTGASWFHARPQAVAYFDGSVNGLQVGAAVTWRGVRIGSVTGIQVNVIPGKGEIRIPVTMELEPERINFFGKGRDDAMRIKDLVKRGLRAQLKLQSLVTGQLYIELEMHPGTPARLVGPDLALTPEIPTIKSTMEALQETFQRLPIDALGSAAVRALTSINEVVSSPELRQVLSRLAESSTELATLLRDLHAEVQPTAKSLTTAAKTMTETLEMAQATLADARRTVNNANAQITSNGKDLHEVLRSADQSFQSARAALASLDSLIAPQTPQRADVDQILRNLTYTSQSLRSLSDELERNPNALLMGRK